jgi:peptidyl-prolyl cis-trans isomerase C
MIEMSLKMSRLAIAVISGLITLSACNAQEPAAKSGVTVNGAAIPQARIDLLVKERISQGQPDTPELHKAITEDLVNRELLAQAAVKKGLDKNPDIAVEMDLAKQAILIRAYLQDYAKAHPISDDMVKAEYDKIKAALGDTEYHVRHILVPTEAEAKDIIAQLKKGVKFEKLAKEKSKDAGSKPNGGDLNWITPANVVKPFADAMVKLKKGEYTKEPVQTQFGWHVIKLEDERAVKAPPLEQVKPQLTQRLQKEMIAAAVSELRAKAKIEEPEAKK